MSDEEDNYNIDKNRISEEEEEEEIEENKENSKIKVNLSESDNDNDNINEEESEENEEKPKMIDKSTPIEKKISKNQKVEKMSKEKYIAIIEQLTNELKLEQKINSDLGDDKYYKEVQKLKIELNKKTNALERIIISNRKQKLALDKLTNEMNELNKKKIEKKEDDESIIKEGESIPNIHEIKDKDVKKALYKMKKLKTENEIMSKKLYQNEDIFRNAFLEDKRKEICDEIENKNNEKELIIKELEEHQNCNNEQIKLKNELKQLKDNLKILKNNLRNIRIKIEKLINEHDEKKDNKNGNNIIINYNINNNIINGIKYYKYSVKKNYNIYKRKINLVKKNINSASSPNIKIKKNNILNVNVNAYTAKKTKKIDLPLISSNSMKSRNKSMVEKKNFTDRIKEYLDGDEDQYMTLINKINNIENKKKIVENKNIKEIKKYNLEIKSLEDKNKYLNCSSKESNNNVRMLKYKLNVIRNDNKKQLKKLKELQKELRAKVNISKEKDNEISLLLTEINEIRTTIKNDEVKSTQEDIVNYIKKIKKEKKVKEAYTETEKETENYNVNNQDDLNESYES